MNLNRLVALPTLSMLCIGIGAVVSADPVTFESSRPTSTANASLMHTSQVVFETPQKGPLDEFDALLNTMDWLPNLLFSSSDNSTARAVVSGSSHHYAARTTADSDRLPALISDLQMDTPITFVDVRAQEQQEKLGAPTVRPAAAIQANASSELPTLDLPNTVTERGTSGVILQYTTTSHEVSPYSLERLEEQHRMFSYNPQVPFAEYDADDHNPNDRSADDFQNGLFVPGRPFPIDDPIYEGDKRDYTQGSLEIIGLAAILALLAGGSGPVPSVPRIPETNSVVGLALLCAGGSLALIRTRRRTTV